MVQLALDTPGRLCPFPTSTGPYTTCPGLSLHATALASFLNLVTSLSSQHSERQLWNGMCEFGRPRVVQVLSFLTL